MDVKLIDLPKPTQLVEDYLASSTKIRSFFDYDFNKSSSYKKRLEELQGRRFKREALIDALKAFNAPFQPHPHVSKNIERLASNDAVVVVGGQQAGILTGPIYTIHKCLSILHFAREQEEKLQVPVIPVFWIAGEDHDFDEVNHVHVYKDHGIRKMPYRLKGSGQVSVSDLPLNLEDIEHWIEEVFETFGETEFTVPLLNEVKTAVRESASLISFFARLIHSLFGKHGLVLMDSGDPLLRQLESDFFLQMIEQAEEIAEGVTEQLVALKGNGYTVNLDQTKGNANLFLSKDGGRVLLSRENGDFINAEKRLRLTKDELMATAKAQPRFLSNNVVTRPIMQDLVLPTLAFIAGPGEIAYWSALKPAFESQHIKMPPVVPRLHLTLVDRHTEKWLQMKNVSLSDALKGGIQAAKEAWLLDQHDWQTDRQFESTKQAMKQVYMPYHQTALSIHSELEKVSQKSWDHIEHQLAYLKKQMDRQIRLVHKVELNRFDTMEATLLPNGGPQERVWTIYSFLNQYGPDLVDRLMESTYVFNGRQHVAYL